MFVIQGSFSQYSRVLDWPLVGGDRSFHGVSTDSRSVPAGALFVALKGARWDGHDYVAAAIDTGAAGALVERRCQVDAPQLLCRDTQRALGSLAQHWRRQHQPCVIGVTGSNGKTTVKGMLAAILTRRAECLVNVGNLNNEIGLPLTLCRLTSQHRFAVLEMGAARPGDIAYLAGLAQPHVAVVNNAAPAHLEGMRNVATVAQVKGELIAALADDGIAVFNADDDHAPTWRRLAGARQVIDFGFGPAAALTGRYSDRGETSRVSMRWSGTEFTAELRTLGVHNASNALAAAAASLALGIGCEQIVAGLAAFEPVAGRFQVRRTPSGRILIEDTYNANPASLRAGVLASIGFPGQHWLVLGDMAELGDDAAALHFQAGAEVKRLGIQRLFCVGDLSRHCVAGFGCGGRFFPDRESLLACLESDVAKDVVCLVKGSRRMRMEEVARDLLAGWAH